MYGKLRRVQTSVCEGEAMSKGSQGRGLDLRIRHTSQKPQAYQGSEYVMPGTALKNAERELRNLRRRFRVLEVACRYWLGKCRSCHGGVLRVPGCRCQGTGYVPNPPKYS